MSDPIGAARAMSGITADFGIQQDGVRRYSVPLDKGAPAEGPGSFGGTIADFVNKVSDAQDSADELRDKLLRGENVELHRVTAAASEARIALDLMVELRNKVLDAYRTLINMQG